MGKKAFIIDTVIGLGAMAILAVALLYKSPPVHTLPAPTITADKTSITAGESVTFTIISGIPNTSYTIQNTDMACRLAAIPCSGVPTLQSFVYENLGQTPLTDSNGNVTFTAQVNQSGVYYPTPIGHNIVPGSTPYVSITVV